MPAALGTYTTYMPGTVYQHVHRSEWAALRKHTPLTLSEAELGTLRGVNDVISLTEVEEIYLPLSRFISLRYEAAGALHQATSTFFGKAEPRVPFIIGIAGSVAAGKSTTARVLQRTLAQWPAHPDVALVATDGFLFPNKVLTERGLMERKGFPESYDQRALIEFLTAMKAGEKQARIPVYSHLEYDIVSGAYETVAQPDILIIEGLNVLQTAQNALTVADFFDFSIYVDAEEEHLKTWFTDRFLTFRETAFAQPDSFFSQFASLTEGAARMIASQVWDGINGVNLRENILPTRERATLIMHKGADHTVRDIRVRKL